MPTPCCFVLLSALSTAPPFMPTLDGKACSVFRCLRALAICLVNTVLATGWLVISVLSNLSEWTHLLDAPPTFPKLPKQEIITPDIGATAAQDEPVKNAVIKPALTPAHLGRIQVQRANSLEKYVHMKTAEAIREQISPRVPLSPGSPGTMASSSTLAESPEGGSLPSSSTGSSSALPLSSPAKESKHPARGRKLMLFRMSSTERSQSSGHSTASERSDHGVRPCMKRVASSLDFTQLHHQHKPARPSKASPVRRTDPYQAPYFFPTPLSPDAAGYARRVRTEHRGSRSSEEATVPLPMATVSPAAILRNQLVEDARRSLEGEGLSPHASGDEGERTGKSVARKASRGRPVSWSHANSLQSKKSATSIDRSPSSSTPSPVKKFFRRTVIRQGSAPTPLTPLYASDDPHNAPHPPSSTSSPTAELKRKRTWFRRRHSLSVADLPSPESLTTEFGELHPPAAPQRR
ncbi:hypothetical protein BC629DRAFT_1594181 [Irpex lacteus]|nr:hypothetical protein BC629DRAFT_1594181 [Irpex lacteus]